MFSAGPRRLFGVGVVALIATALLLTLTAEPAQDYRKLFGLWTTRWAIAGLIGALFGAVMLISSWSTGAGLSATITIGLITFVWVVLEALGQFGVVSYADMMRGGSDRAPLGTRPQPNAHESGQTYMDTAVGWGFESEPIDFEYKTNALGFRNLPDRTEAALYLLGDSILVSALTKFEHTITARLETLTNRRTMTIALIGLSPADEHLIFRESKLPLDGRMVLQFIFEGNDLRDTADDNVDKTSAAAAATVRDKSLTQQVVLILQRATQPVISVAHRRVCTIDGQRHTFYWARETFDGYEGEMSSIAESILGFRREVEAAGARYGIVFVPTKLRVLADECTFPANTDLVPVDAHLSPMPKLVQTFADEHGIPLLDVTDVLKAQAKKRPIPWFWGDTHPNAEGHRVMAEKIAEWSFVKTSTRAP